jgi:UDP-glucose 4-epimerase
VRVVVTGLSGNIGTALLRRLATDRLGGGAGAGEVDLLGICRRPPEGPPYDRARWASVDLASADAAAALRPLVDGADAVVHLAWPFQPSHDTAYLERVGVGGTAAVLEACADAGVPHLVHMSSLGAYSPGPDTPDGPRVDESWPHGGISSHAYSRHKAWAERLLDAHPADRAPLVTRLRPALVLQADAASGMMRYGLPGWLPAAALRLLPVLPLDGRFVVQAVHADDVAAAIVAALEHRPEGAVNLTAEPPVTRASVAGAFGVPAVPFPRAALRALVAATWHARLQPLDPGWIDLAFETPLMDATRAAEELGWKPTVDAERALGELVAAMRAATGVASSPVLRPRRLADLAKQLLRHGPVGSRRLT